MIRLVLAAALLLVAAPVRAQDAGVEPAGDGGVEEAVGDAGGDAGATPRAPRRVHKARPIPPDRLPRVEARLGVDKVELGQVIPLEIDVHAQPGDKVHLRETRRFGRFELIDKARRPGKAGGDGPSEILSLDLISFEMGQLEIPAIELLVVLEDGRTGSVSTNPLPIKVTDPLGNENDPQPRADHDPRPVLTTDRRALWVGGALAALLLAALFGAVIGRLRARKGPPPGPPPPPPRPPEEVALEKLDAVRDSTLLEDGEIKTFHVAISEAVREYLGGRYGFDSLELTTDELLSILEGVVVRGVSERELRRFLRDTDLVKFAKWRPDEDHCRELLEQAYDIVRRTTAAELAQEIRPTPERRSGASPDSEAAAPQERETAPRSPAPDAPESTSRDAESESSAGRSGRGDDGE